MPPNDKVYNHLATNPIQSVHLSFLFLQTNKIQQSVEVRESLRELLFETVVKKAIKTNE